MNEDKQRQWLLIDSTILKLKRGRWWMTDLDPWKKHVQKAIEELEIAKKILEQQ